MAVYNHFINLRLANTHAKATLLVLVGFCMRNIRPDKGKEEDREEEDEEDEAEVEEEEEEEDEKEEEKDEE